jgi:hypothetical protein
VPAGPVKAFVRAAVPELGSRVYHYYLAWNPRLLRLNPHASRRRDFLAEALARKMAPSRI